jgi:hypothetical protein
LDDGIIFHYDSQGFKNLSKIDSGGTSSVYAAYWKDSTKFAIKKFNESSNFMKEIINEVSVLLI